MNRVVDLSSETREAWRWAITVYNRVMRIQWMSYFRLCTCRDGNSILRLQKLHVEAGGGQHVTSMLFLVFDETCQEDLTKSTDGSLAFKLPRLSLMSI